MFIVTSGCESKKIANNEELSKYVEVLRQKNPNEKIYVERDEDFFQDFNAKLFKKLVRNYTSSTKEVPDGIYLVEVVWSGRQTYRRALGDISVGIGGKINNKIKLENSKVFLHQKARHVIGDDGIEWAEESWKDATKGEIEYVFEPTSNQIDRITITLIR